MQSSFIKPTAGSRAFDVLNHLFLILLCLVMIYPIFYLAMLSVTASDVPLTEGSGIPWSRARPKR